MKRYRFQPIIVLLIVALNTSCKDYLQMDPLDQLSSETFWTSKAQFDIALSANYALLQYRYWADQEPNFDAMTDNCFGQNNMNATTTQMVTGVITPQTGVIVASPDTYYLTGMIPGVYQNLYTSIARTNIFLKELSTYKGTDMSEADKNLYEGQVRFLRAYFNFQLAFFYGDVPLILEPLTISTQNKPKNSRSEILASVLDDLDFAIANLNSAPYSVTDGHATKSSAQALKARVLIFSAYGDTGTPDIASLTQVRDLCLEIMPLYTLYPNFAKMFQQSGQKDNKEIIFGVNFLSPTNCSLYDFLYGYQISLCPLKSFVSSFECTDGLPWGVSPLTVLSNPLGKRDPRLKATVCKKDSLSLGNGTYWKIGQGVATPTGYILSKFLSPENVPYGYATLTATGTIKFRLGEILLMYAEAQNEIAGPDATVYKAMKDLRARVSMPPFPEGLTKADMRDKIRHERRIELAFEEHLRYFDLKRWRTANTVLNAVTDGFLVYHFEDRFYKWPIPQSQIDMSHGVLNQNPDYQ